MLVGHGVFRDCQISAYKQNCDRHCHIGKPQGQYNLYKKMNEVIKSVYIDEENTYIVFK